ncbi:ankyrin repeat-containing protein-like [Iris pallida]|uniref:Ankyrin repeat-containing protein-like n=1 Tax=Iris pallida TaxID=29817 RepID=A0AAX6G8A3_IRIPA|nr:ankyrin repeat-containing protein-like [Iris pallida]
MDHRLREASFSGDVHSLHQLLQEDRLLLNRPTYCSDNPLHVAAMLGHADFAAEVVRLRPDLARELDAGGHTPLHLAAANGHAEVAKVLLGNSSAGVPGHELCLLRDKYGLTPVHAAALKGRTDVLRELVTACPDSVRVATGRGETALHLAVRSSSLEAVEFLVETVGAATAAELLNAKDDKGNTALHLAVARKQLQTMKFMLSKPSVDVNSVNLRGLTPLDVLLESPTEHGDMVLGETIRAAGGKTAAELELPPPPAAVLLPRQAIGRQKPRVKNDEGYRDTPGTLMVVATLIATITFQAALNPPGGFIPDDGKSHSSVSKVAAAAADDQRPGKVILEKELKYFLMFNVFGLFASLSIILLLICVSPRRKRMMGFLSWIMWAAVLSTALAFQIAIAEIYKSNAVVRYLSFAWSGILCVAAVWIFFRFAVFLLKRVGWWKGRRHGHARCGGLLVVKRIGVVAALLLATGATVFLILSLLVPILWPNLITAPASALAHAPAPQYII